MTHITREVVKNYKGVSTVRVGSSLVDVHHERLVYSENGETLITCYYQSANGDPMLYRFETDELKGRVRSINRARTLSTLTSFAKSKISERIQIDTTGNFQRIFVEGNTIVNSKIKKEYGASPSQMTGADCLALMLTEDVSLVTSGKLNRALSHLRHVYDLLDGLDHLPFDLESLKPESFINEETQIILDGIAKLS